MNFTLAKTKGKLQDRKTEHFKALAKSDHSSAVADHVKTTGHNIKWDYFDISERPEKLTFFAKLKDTLFIQELKPSLNVNVSREVVAVTLQVNVLLQIIFLSRGSRFLIFTIYSFHV